MLILCLEALVIFLTTNIQIYSVPSLRMEIFHRRALQESDSATEKWPSGEEDFLPSNHVVSLLGK